MPPPRSVRVDSGNGTEPSDVYFRLKGVVNDLWDAGAPPGPSFERWVMHYPFGFGRQRGTDEALGLSDAEDCWFLCDSNKVSRKHAVIFYDERSQQFKIKCYSLNGVDVNRAFWGWGLGAWPLRAARAKPHTQTPVTPTSTTHWATRTHARTHAHTLARRAPP